MNVDAHSPAKSPRARTRSRYGLAARLGVVLLALLIAGCSGDSGDEPRPGEGRGPRDAGGDRGAAPGGEFDRPDSGNLPPISPTPGARDPAATPNPAATPPATAAPGTDTRSVVEDERVYSCSIDGEHLTLDHVQAAQPQPDQGDRTVLAIDGHASDWDGRPVAAVDPDGDAEPGFPDFGPVHAFRNRDALYLSARIPGFASEFDSLEISATAGDRDFFIGWAPGGDHGWTAETTTEWVDLGPAKHSSFALATHFEARIDLRDVDSPGDLTLTEIRVMAGDCCGETWRAVDRVAVTEPVAASAEIDPEWRLAPIGSEREAALDLAAPDTRAIDVQFDKSAERARVVGLAGAVPPLTQLLVGNIELNDYATLAADINGAFATDVAALEGTHVLVKQDRTARYIRADRHRFDENLIAPGVLISIPVSPAADGVAFSTAAEPCCGTEAVAPFAIAGTLESDRLRAGDRVRANGQVTVFAGEASRPRDDYLQFQITLIGDSGGRQVGRAGKFISPFLTPTGLPIERNLEGAPLGRVTVASREISFSFDGRHWVAPFDVEIEIPDSARDGIYGLLVDNLWNLGQAGVAPAAGLRPFDIVTRDDNQHRPTIATLVVGDPSPMRLTTTILADEVDDGARGGVIAREDFGLFDIAGRSSSRHDPVIQRLDPFGEPRSYRLEPYAPMLDVVDRALPGAPALNPDLTASSLKISVQRPDGAVDVIGPAPLTRYGVKSPRTVWGDPMGLGGGELREIPQLLGEGDTFAYEFPQDGDYVVTLNGRVPDAQGNVHGICGTYDVTVAEQLEVETSFLPTTPFEIGDSIAPAVTVQPGVAADVSYTVTHVAADGAVDRQTFRGTANRFGWWDGAGETYTFKRDGEYRVDIDTRYRSADGRLWVGRMRFGSVVATPDAPFAAHGRRGPDGQTELAPPWAFEESFESEDSAHWQFPYFTGDVLWGDTEPGPGQAVVTHLSVQPLDDSHDLVARATRLTTEYGSHGELPLDVAVRASQVPLTLAPEDRRLPGSHPDELSLWSYIYGSAQRPGVRVREMIQGNDINGGYWRFGDAYHGQLGNGPEGDLPGDFKFLYGGAVIRDPAAGEGVYAIYGSSWVHTLPDDPLGSRLFPPFQGAAGGPDGGPLFVTHGREIDIFMSPMGVRPGAVLEAGDTFRMAGPVMPTLPSLVEYTVTAPDGTTRELGGRANAIGYFYDPADDFTVDQPGVWTVELSVTHDGMTSAGPVQQPFPSGGPLTPDGRTFRFFVVDGASERLAWTTDLEGLPPSEWFERRESATFTAALPDGWEGDSARLVVTIPGNVLVDEEVAVSDGVVRWQLDAARMTEIASNFDTERGLADTLTVTMLADGAMAGSGQHAVASIVTHGARLPETPPAGVP